MFKVSSRHFGAVSVALSLLLFTFIVLVDEAGGITFSVNATTTINYYSFDYRYDEYLVKQFDKQTVKDFPAVLYLGDPADDGTFQEKNAFNLRVWPDDWKGDEEGTLDLKSARVRLDCPDDYPLHPCDRSLAQFWDITMSGTSVQGTLYDNHYHADIGYDMVNHLYAWDLLDPPMWQSSSLLPMFGMSVGTVIYGTIDSNNSVVDLYIHG